MTAMNIEKSINGLMISPSSEAEKSTLLGAAVSDLNAPCSPRVPKRALRLSPKPEDLLGRGGFGLVYKIWDDEFGRYVALKLVRSDWRAHGQVREWFFEEAQILGQLQHPGIVPAHEYGDCEKHGPYLIMRWVQDGETLETLIQQARADEGCSTLLGYLESVARTVAYAHSKNALHLDLKPLNIMVDKHGQVLVMDWGLSLRLKMRPEPREEGDSIPVILSPASSTVIKGLSRGYSAPEIRQGQIAQVGPRTDVFSLGMILCKILVRGPVETDDLSATLALLDQCGQDSDLVDLAKRAIEFDVRNRKNTAKDFADAIAAWRSKAEAEARRAERVGRTMEQLMPLLEQLLQRPATSSQELDEWQSVLQSLVRDAPGYARGHLILGMILRIQRQYADAVISLGTVISLDPDFPAANYNLGLVFQAQNRPQEAVEAFGREPRSSVYYPDACSHRGWLLIQRGEFGEAAAACREAVEHRSELADAWLNLSVAERELGNSAAADEASRIAHELQPES